MTLPAKWIKYIITSIIILAFGYFIYKFRNDLYIATRATPSQFLQLSVLILLSILINGSKLNRILAFFEVNVHFRVWFGLSALTTTLNNVLFKAGSLATSNYLKKNFSFPYSTFIGSLGADQMIALFMTTFAGTIVSLYMYLAHSGIIGLVSLGYFFIASVLWFMMRGRLNFPLSQSDFWNAVIRSLHSLNSILANRTLFYNLCAHNLGTILATTLRLYTAASILQMDISLGYCLLFTTVVTLVAALPAIQSDIGTRELLVGLFAETVGVGFQAGLLATAVDRLFVVFWALFLTTAYNRNLFPVHEEAGKI